MPDLHFQPVLMKVTGGNMPALVANGAISLKIALNRF
jgi:hypothetical protein